MNKSLLLIFLLLPFLAKSQVFKDGDFKYDSLQRLTQAGLEGVELVDLWNELANYHKFSRADSGIYYTTRSLSLSRKLGYERGELIALQLLSLSYNTLGDRAESLKVALQGAKRAEEMNDLLMKAVFQLHLGVLYYKISSYTDALRNIKAAEYQFLIHDRFDILPITSSWIGTTYSSLEKKDSAVYYLRKSIKHLNQSSNPSGPWLPYQFMGSFYRDQQKLDSCIFYYKKSILNTGPNLSPKATVNLSLAKAFRDNNQLDSAKKYANISLEIAMDNDLIFRTSEAARFLSNLVENDDLNSAIQYRRQALQYIDSLEKLREISAFDDVLNFDDQQREFELEKATASYQNKVQRLWIFSIAGALLSAIVLSLILYRNNKSKQKANSLLKEQKKEIQSTLEKLESTQSQLIQSEKMASLGELTAGIAHEIQNPLNFVNNFSEVNSELVEELREEIKKGDLTEIEAIANDIAQNEQKIMHHGLRADSIVKGMLMHSSTGTGEKEPTDINALADEYLRLAYYGMRAKDKSFNAEFKTEFDLDLPKVNVVPQDIGRVLLNLINNAFYVVSEASAKESVASSSAILSNSSGKTEVIVYKPLVTVSTKILPLTPSRGGQQRIEISIKDNGPGIQNDIKDKIFQPFFTTKPTGSGTGLGLSLSYDIVKAHGGEIKVESEVGKGSEFVIYLPIN